MAELFSGKGDLIELNTFALAEPEPGVDEPHIDTSLHTHSEIACQLVHHVLKSGGRISIPSVIEANRTAAPGFIYINENSAVSEHASSTGHSALWTWLSAKGFSMGLMLSSQGESAGPVAGFSGRHDAFLATVNLDHLAVAVGAVVSEVSIRVPLRVLTGLLTAPNELARWIAWPQPGTVAPPNVPASNHYMYTDYPAINVEDEYYHWVSTTEEHTYSARIVNLSVTPLSEPIFDIEVDQGRVKRDFQLIKSMGRLLLFDYVGDAVHPGSDGYSLIFKACVAAAKQYCRDNQIRKVTAVAQPRS